VCYIDKVMSKEEIFAIIAETLRRLFGERLVSIKVFGSYAAGDETPDSDVDILVVLETAEEGPIGAAAHARAALELPVPVDVIVRTPSQLEERLALGDDFFGHIEANGLEILEATRERMA
jgi:predicted nucleotidyltransferase